MSRFVPRFTLKAADDFTLDGIEIMDAFDSAAEDFGPAMQQAVLDMEWQVRRTDGTWVRVDPERVRLAPRGEKK